MAGSRFIAALLATALTISVAGCSASSEAYEIKNPKVAVSPTFPPGTTMDRLAKAGTLTVGTKFDQPLFGLKGLDNNPMGFDVEIAKIIAGDLGIPAQKIQWIETPSKVRDEAVTSGKADMVIATYTINAKRKKIITFGGPYYQTGTQLLVLNDSPVKDNSALKNPSINVCSATGASYLPDLEKLVANQNQIVLFDVYSKCVDALRTGQVQAIAADTSILMGLSSNAGRQYKIVGKSFNEQELGIGIKKGDIPFCEFINKSLKDAAADGRYKTAWAKTAGVVQPKVPALPELMACQ